MGVRVPHPRISPPFTIVPEDFDHDVEAIKMAFSCLSAISELADAGRADVIQRCVSCDRYNWRRTFCDDACRLRAWRETHRRVKR